MLIGYARVSTQDQNLELQIEALTKAGCKKIFEDKVSGSRAERPGLAKARDVLREGDKEVARCQVTAKHTGDGLGKPPKGNALSFTGMTWVRIQEGKIAEAWNNFDFLTMYRQMD